MSDITTINVMKDEFGWEIPVETVPVPSEGKIYPLDSGLHNLSTIKIKAMTAQEEDILSSRALIQEGTVISHLLKSCILEANVDAENMILGDRNALMVAVRVTGYGVDYFADVTCPECGAKSPGHKFDLGSLEIKRLTIDPVSPGENLFDFTLPITKKNIQFSFLTGADEREISITAERRRKTMPGLKVDDAVTSRLGQSIKSVEGIRDRNKINSFVKGMPARDAKAIRKYIQENEPGIDMSSWMRCPSCSKESKVSLPLGLGFFWPDR